MLPIRIVLIDDNPAMLEVVAQLLTSEHVLVAQLLTGESIVREILPMNPDLILLDVSLGDLSGFDVAEVLQAGGCLAKIVFCSIHEDTAFVNAGLNVGAAGYVFKSRLQTDLIPAINAAVTGNFFTSCSN